MKILASYLGGSILYGLDTPASDKDERGVFLNDTVSTILGAMRHDTQSKKTETEDVMQWELRHFLSLLGKGNTQMLECLWADDTCFTFLDPLFNEWIRKNRNRLINSAALYPSLKGYIFSESQLAQGFRKGRIGGARYAVIEKLGFSPKNYVQLLRLAWAGATFYESAVFPVNIKYYDTEFHKLLMSIKLHPEDWKVDDLNQLVAKEEKRLDGAHARTAVHWKVDTELVDNVLLAFYMPLLEEGLPWARI